VWAKEEAGMSESCDLAAVDARQLIGRGSLSPFELLESCLARISAVNGAVNAVVALDEEGARAKARYAERAVMAGEKLGPLHGLPVLIKDTQDTEGLRTTYGSPLFAGHIPSADQDSVAR